MSSFDTLRNLESINVSVADKCSLILTYTTQVAQMRSDCTMLREQYLNIVNAVPVEEAAQLDAILPGWRMPPELPTTQEPGQYDPRSTSNQ